MKQVLIAIDQLANSLFGGYADETLSARAYRWSINGDRDWPRRLIDGLFFLEDRHCYHSFVAEQDRAQLPREYRDA